MLRVSHFPTSCCHTPHEAHETGRSVLRTFWSAFGEALAGSRQYRSLRSQGLSHDAAIRQALGIGANLTPTPAQPLYFAGRA